MLVIGELINATRKQVRRAVLEHDREYIQKLARRQAERGADYIDVNVSTGSGKQDKEAEDMAWAVQAVQEAADRPVAVDTTSPAVLEAGLAVHHGQALINSISAEKERMEPFLALAVKYKAPLVALAVSDEGIPEDVEGRLAICEGLVKKLEAGGVKRENIYFDPLVFPLGVDHQNAVVTLEALREIKSRVKGVKTTLGLSNVSHGLPARSLLNRSFLALAMQWGLDSAILDPLDRQLMSTVAAVQALLGHDPYCGGFLKAYRRGDLITD